MNSSPKIDFRDRNAVERFLEGKKFRRCINLRCESVNHPKMQMLYMPVCLEGRFAKEGVAQHMEIPLPNRPLSPVTYTTIQIWAPLISCPPDCKGYRNRTVAKVLALFKKESHGGNAPKKEPWSRGERIAAWTLVVAVVAIGASFVIPEVRQFFHLEKRPQTVVEKLPQSPEPVGAAPASPPAPSTGQTGTKTQHAKPRVIGNSNIVGNNVAGNGNTVGNNNQIAPTANAPNGIAITGGMVTNPTVNNFGPAEPNVTWSQIRGSPTEDKKATVVVTLKVDHSFEIPAFLALCDRPCETVGATAPGYSQASFLNAKQNPNVAGFVFKAPRPLGSGLPVEWIIKSEDGQPVEVKAVEKLPPTKLPPELR